MSKKPELPSPSKTVSKDFPDMPPESLSTKNDFDKSAEIADLAIRSSSDSAIIRLGGLLRYVMSSAVGLEAMKSIGCEYDYNADGDYHIFKLFVKKHISGQNHMSSPVKSIVRMELNEGIQDFLKNLTLLMDNEDGDIYPQYGEIYVENKLGFLNCLKDYVEAYCVESTNIPEATLPMPEIPVEFGEKAQFTPAQTHREYISAISEIVEKQLAQDPSLKDDILESALMKPYSSLQEFNAYSFATYQQVPESSLRIANLIAMIEQRIRHEDNLGPERDEYFQKLFQTQNFSVN